MGLDMGLARVQRKGEDVGYWRKANAIRGWIEKNLEDFQDNGETYFPKEKIEELLSVCETVLQHPEKAGELLPPTEGFFFGSNRIDEWYWEDVRKTVDILENVLKTTDFQEENIMYWEWY